MKTLLVLFSRYVFTLQTRFQKLHWLVAARLVPFFSGSCQPKLSHICSLHPFEEEEIDLANRPAAGEESQHLSLGMSLATRAEEHQQLLPVSLSLSLSLSHSLSIFQQFYCLFCLKAIRTGLLSCEDVKCKIWHLKKK